MTDTTPTTDASTERPEFPWVIRGVSLNVVRTTTEALLHYDRPSGSFKIVEHGTQGKLVEHAVTTNKNRYDVYFDDYSCGLLQAQWDGWDPQPNCPHAHLTLGTPTYPHCNNVLCWNYVDRDKEPEWVLAGEVTTYVPGFYKFFPALQPLAGLPKGNRVRRREHNRSDVTHGRSKWEYNLADLRAAVAKRKAAEEQKGTVTQ